MGWLSRLMIATTLSVVVTSAIGRKDDHGATIPSTGAEETSAREKAHEVSLELESAPPIDVPPRGIDDILEALERAEAMTPITRQLRDVALEEATDSDAGDARFYLRRAIAARNLGLYRKAIADLDIALETATGESRAVVYIELYSLHDELGEHDRAVTFARRGLETATGANSGFTKRALLSIALSQTGSLDEAREHLKQVLSFRPNRRNSGNWQHFRRAMQAGTAGFYAYYRGEYRDAEVKFQEGASISERDLERGVVEESPYGHNLKTTHYRTERSPISPAFARCA